MPPANSEESRWLLDHVIPHEPMLRAWLQASFGRQVEIDDIVQEAYRRLLAARVSGTVVSPRAFLFQAARNFALNVVRHQGHARPAPFAETILATLIDGGDGVSESVAHAEDLQLLIRAIQTLPERCRQVFTLRKIYGLSQKEIAERLGISENTVEVQASVGIRKCSEYFKRHGDSPKRS